MFDPLGLISPVVVSMKILFQGLCVAKIDWDQELEREPKRKWEAWVEDLAQTRDIAVNRCLYKQPREQVEERMLVGFADASTKAYCAMIYLVCSTRTGSYVSLIASKTRVAPMKALTIPRLELMAALILARLMQTVRKALGSSLQISEVKYWLDSKTALWWIQNRGEWKQFVRHRVNEILELTEKGEWHYCPTDQNPADIGSRGIPASVLKNKALWWNGPKWLSLGREQWPGPIELNETPETLEEEKKATVAVVTAEPNSTGMSSVLDINRFSSVLRLVRATAWMRRFIHNTRAEKLGSDKLEGELSVQEITEAESEWIKNVQTGVRQEENYKQLVSKFGLVEEKGILKCEGRMVEADLELEARKPILLPKNHRLTKLVIEDCHKRVHHCGVRATLAELRSKYWVPSGRQVVKKILGRCVVCRKISGKPYNAPPTAALPEFRVRASVFKVRSRFLWASVCQSNSRAYG